MASSFFIRPSLFSMLVSWLEIFDLSHSRSSAAILDSGVLWRVRRTRGGINGNGWSDVCECGKIRETWAQRKFCEEEQVSGASKGMNGG